MEYSPDKYNIGKGMVFKCCGALGKHKWGKIQIHPSDHFFNSDQSVVGPNVL